MGSEGAKYAGKQNERKKDETHEAIKHTEHFAELKGSNPLEFASHKFVFPGVITYA
jgi:hypothetical protein